LKIAYEKNMALLELQLKPELVKKESPIQLIILSLLF
jgi:hypothetical protein